MFCIHVNYMYVLLAILLTEFSSFFVTIPRQIDTRENIRVTQLMNGIVIVIQTIFVDCTSVKMGPFHPTYKFRASLQSPSLQCTVDRVKLS